MSVLVVAILLLAAGVVLSAFFSGAETGFYRVNRVRLVLDAMGGDFVAAKLLTVTNHPSMFVATVLVGNNLANYLTSFAIVIGAQALYGSASNLPGIVAPLILAPGLFIYGELLPKNLFHDAPNRLLRAVGLPLLACHVLFLPVTALLWALSKIIERLSGESPEHAQLTLARAELQQVFDEGHEAGILHPAQRGLAQGLFAVADQPIRGFVIPAGRVARVRQGMTKREIRRLARRHRLSAVPVESPDRARRLIGYYRTVDLYLDESETPVPLYPLVDIPDTETHIAALMRLESSGESLGRVVDANGKTVGFVTARHLTGPFLRAG